MVERMRFALIATDGVVAADGEFAEADTQAPPGGVIDQLRAGLGIRE